MPSFKPSAADVIDGIRHLRQERGIAVAVAGDQGADLDARSVSMAMAVSRVQPSK